MPEPQRLTVVLPTYDEAANLPRAWSTRCPRWSCPARGSRSSWWTTPRPTAPGASRTTSPRFVPVLLAALPGADMVLGSRFAPGGKVDENWAWYRKLLSWVANSVYVRVILGSSLRDMTGGFRLWRAATLSGMDIQKRIGASGYVFQVEMAYVAQRLGYVVKEVPIEFPDRVAGERQMSVCIQVEAAGRTWDVRRRHTALGPGDRAA